MNSQLSAADPIDVSVILVCWNSLRLTTAAIRSLREHTSGVRYEIIVIDNGSTRDAGASELALRFPEIRVIINPDNRGYASANNQGLAVARGRYALLLNSDTEQTENAIGRAVEYMDAHPEVGILGVMHRNGDPGRTYQPSSSSFPDPATSCRSLLFGMLKRSRPLNLAAPSPEADVDWVTGSFLMVRRACLDRIGPLDERFFVYAEDIDYCFQAWKAGWRVRYWPGVSLVHLGGSSADQIRDKTFMIYRGEFEFYRKNRPLTGTMAFYASMSTRLTLSTLYVMALRVGGRSRWADVGERWYRLWNFMTLRPSRNSIKNK